MGKKDSKAARAAKQQRGYQKAAKAAKKSASKDKKLAAKSGEEEDVDLDAMLEEFRQQQREFEEVTIKTVERPSKRQGSVLVPAPVQGSKRELLLFGGETMVDDHYKFHNDLFVYNPDNDIWRLVTSPNSPMPRSGHAMCAHPTGIVLVHGGEFSSPKQTTFYHYGDTWVLDAATKEWTKIDLRNSPSSRSGHRMCVWKNYILLHGGFRDLGTSTQYLNDLWAFDVSDYKWHHIEFPGTMSLPDARSGHSLLPTPDGAILWGGYSKVKASKGVQKGRVHQDTWQLIMKGDLTGVRWERRKKGPFAPSPRIGCSMVPHQSRGILFGGVYDTQETEESMESIFFNQLYSYNPQSNRWFSLGLRKSQQNKPQQKQAEKKSQTQDLSDVLKSLNINIDEMLEGSEEPEEVQENEERPPSYTVVNQLPHPRFNAALAVSHDELFIYGGIWEKEDTEYAFDSFYSIDLGKLDGVKVYWENLGVDPTAPDSKDGDNDDDSEEESSSDPEDIEQDEQLVAEEPEVKEEEEEDTIEEEEDPDKRPWLPHPKPFESMSNFYRNHINAFVEWALKQDRDARSKDLRRLAFELCQSRWWERRESVRASEDRMEQMGGVDEVVERSNGRNSRR